MADFTMKENDTLPKIKYQLQDEAGNVDITGASVKFIMSAQKGTPNKVDAAATIVDAATGQVEYQWIAADTDDPGDYEAEWQVTFGDANVLTFPNDSYITVQVLADLNSEVD